MKVISDYTTLRDTIAHYKKSGKTVGLVPTMGALHAGHLSLVNTMQSHADITVVSIFVNPKQFAPHEDFDSYPRTQEEDQEKLTAHGVDILYIPDRQDIYPEQFSTTLQTGNLSTILEGVRRPHFFDGVALVVTKLLNIVSPEYAIFGEKDYQQLCVIRQTVRDLNMPVTILSAAIIRDQSGLALSSRNRYLSEKAHTITAPALHHILCVTRDKIMSGEEVNATLAWGTKTLLESGFETVDYLALHEATTLTPLTDLKAPARLLVAAYLENVRLIDNIAIT